MSTVIEALEVVKSSVGGNKECSKTEHIGSPSLGDVVRQGDVYLVNIDKLPKGDPTNDMQLAPGSTQGSRHIISGNVEIVTGVKTFEKFNVALIGPAFKCKGETEVTHPEHGNKILPSDTAWQVIYQQAYAEEIRRVQD